MKCYLSDPSRVKKHNSNSKNGACWRTLPTILFWQRKFTDITKVALCYPSMLCTLDRLWSSNADANHFALHACTMSHRHSAGGIAVLCRNT